MKLLLLPFEKGNTFYSKRLDRFMLIPTIKIEVNNYANIGLNQTVRSIEIQFLNFGFGVIK